MIRTYVIPHDYGFAPNPYGGFLTLACCKPRIRVASALGDWVVATLPAGFGAQDVCFAGRVSAALSFDAYYNDDRFAEKRPTKTNTGDAIYRRGEDGNLVQLRNRFHFADTMAHDTSVDRVLVCEEFWYFGDRSVRLTDELARSLIKRGPGHRNNDDDAVERELHAFLGRYPQGRIGQPRMSLR